MRALAMRLQVDALNICMACGDLFHQIASHAGHGHTPWG